MEQNYTPRKKVKVEIRRSSTALKIVLTVLILFSIAALVALRWVHNGIGHEIQKKRDEAGAIEFANEELEEKKKALDSVQSIQDIARDELGLVDPDTILIDPHVINPATTMP